MKTGIIFSAMLLTGCAPVAVLGGGDLTAFEGAGGAATTYCRAAGSDYTYKLYGQPCYASDVAVSEADFDKAHGQPARAMQADDAQVASFHDFLAASFGAQAAQPFTGSDQTEVQSCVADAIADGIPATDQDSMLRAVNTSSLTPSSAAAFKKWLGLDYAHGPVVQPDVNNPATYAGGVSHYQDGTPVAPRDPAIERRVRANLPKHCPDIAGRVRRIF